MKTHAPRKYANTLPKFWRQKLTESQQSSAKIIHWDLITRFTDGSATVVDLWDWIETGYTYSQIMQLQMDEGTEFTQEAIGAISDQLDIYAPVIERYRVHKRVGFDGHEMQVARSAASVMDGLIDIDCKGISVSAALWSQAQMRKIKTLDSRAMKPVDPRSKLS